MNHENVLGLAGLESEEPFSASEARPARSRTLPALDLLTMVYGFKLGNGGSTVTYAPFGGSGPDHSQGLVPDPGGVAGTTRFLNENGSWVVPPDDRRALGNFATGGVIGTAAATVDTYAEFVVNQTTADQDLELPSPTAAETNTVVMVANGGTKPFTMHTKTIPVNGSAVFVWNQNTGTWGDPPAWMIPFGVNLSTAGSHVVPTATIDACDTVHVATESSGFAVTLADPTATQDGKRFRVVNVNAADAFTIQGMTLRPNQGADFHWVGAVWAPLIAAPFNDRLALGNFAAGGAIGTAAATIDKYTQITVAQTTTGQTLTIPTPTLAGNSTVIITNSGTAPFTIGFGVIPPNASQVFTWNGTGWGVMRGWLVAFGGSQSVNAVIGNTAIVDIGELIYWVATNPNLEFTLPTPTTGQNNKYYRVVNNGTSPTNYAYTMYGVRVGLSQFADFVWSGTVWMPAAARVPLIALTNFAAGGAIGTASATVDTLAPIVINQTTAGQTLSLPTPTVTTTPSRVSVSNAGTNSFTMHGTVIAVNGTTTFVWNTNTNTWSA